MTTISTAGSTPDEERNVSDPTEDSEIDFDDETDDDQEPIDYVEAREVGADLDDPNEAAAEEDQELS
jgi:hypothetical protein